MNDVAIIALSVLSACVLLIVLAVQMQIKSLGSKIDKIMAKLDV